MGELLPPEPKQPVGPIRRIKASYQRWREKPPLPSGLQSLIEEIRAGENEIIGLPSDGNVVLIHPQNKRGSQGNRGMDGIRVEVRPSITAPNPDGIKTSYFSRLDPETGKYVLEHEVTLDHKPEI